MDSFTPDPVLAALAARPDGAAVLGLRGTRVAVVGGFVRDSLIGRAPREIDLVVEGDPRLLAEQLGGELSVHAAFLACHVARDGWAIELTRARRERYVHPGALPTVEPATIEQDLVRRDFGVNAIAVTLDDGQLLAPAGALEDLAARRLRVLHEQSFIDDPTRVMRLARYRTRLGFAVAPETAQLAELARLDTVSGARVGAELRLILGEPDPLGPLDELAGKLPLAVDRELVAAAQALAPPDADRELLILATVARNAPSAWLDALELTARERAVIDFGARAASLAAALGAARSPSELRDVLRTVPPEAVAIAGALGPTEAARRWLGDVRHVKLEIGGDDLIAAGVQPGPELGARLERTLRRKLDGELEGGREAELESALGGGP